MNEITKELLDALKDLLDANAIPSTACKERAAYDKARAAIAKAEAILAVPQPADDGWIPWAGGERPVERGDVVRVKAKNGEIDTDKAHFYDWHHTGSAFDIVAYRVVKP